MFSRHTRSTLKNSSCALPCLFQINFQPPDYFWKPPPRVISCKSSQLSPKPIAPKAALESRAREPSLPSQSLKFWTEDQRRYIAVDRIVKIVMCWTRTGTFGKYCCSTRNPPLPELSLYKFHLCAILRNRRKDTLQIYSVASGSDESLEDIEKSKVWTFQDPPVIRIIRGCWKVQSVDFLGLFPEKSKVWTFLDPQVIRLNQTDRGPNYAQKCVVDQQPSIQYQVRRRGHS